MSQADEWFKLSRRDFAKAAAASIVGSTMAGTVSAMSEQTEPATTTPSASQPHANAEIVESRVKWLEDQLGQAIPTDLRSKVAKQIAGNDAMWKRGRKFPVPDGTEPAFVFQPVPASRGRS